MLALTSIPAFGATAASAKALNSGRSAADAGPAGSELVTPPSVDLAVVGALGALALVAAAASLGAKLREQVV